MAFQLAPETGIKRTIAKLDGALISFGFRTAF